MKQKFLLLPLFAWACSSTPATPPSAPPPPENIQAQAPKVVEVKLQDVGLDAAALDKSVKPCDDFYQFACGGWIAATQLPSDKPRWVRSFSEIHKRNEADLKAMLEEAASNPGADPAKQKIGKFYAACMNEAAIEKLGLAPVKPLLDQVKKVKDAASLTQVVAELHRQGIEPLFSFSADQDAKNATQIIFNLDQGGLGLPDRDYYTADNDDKKKIRVEYAKHVERMMLAGGYKPADAKKAAVDVMRVETELAKVSKTKVERRDPVTMYNKIDREGVEKAAPTFGWKVYFTTLGVPEAKDIDVSSPKYLEGMDAQLKAIKFDTWRNYLAWHVLRSMAPALGKKFVDENFQLQKILTGQAEIEARWKRCVAATDRYLGEVLAQPYVEKRFAGESKVAAEKYVAEISAAFGRELDLLTWMDGPTREKARAKLGTLANLIGYPAKWKNYDWQVNDAFATNVLQGRAFLLKDRLAKVGKPVDRGEWEMTPPTVNAYYNPLKNQMVFPAGILQPPFYSVDAAIPVNLGAMGMVVGHELTHGFDDQGSQFDADGNLKDWWVEGVKAAFKEKTQCVANQYNNYEPVPGSKINGQLTLGENIADLGGLKLAFGAYRSMRAKAEELKVAEGFTEDQQFFLANAQIWCAKATDEYARMQVQTDPHSAAKFRVNGPMSNLSEFAEAFSCPVGSPMRPAQTCAVW